MNTTKNFSVFKSSAGSGKTYTLVREYIALSLQSPDYFRHILAITFTNKAANEMKQRIMLGLVQISDPEAYAGSAAVKFMLPYLSKTTGLAESAVARRASEVLSRILHNYDDFSVRTIDSFVSRIIRTFAYDLHLPVDFEIEMDTELLLDQAVEQLISKVGTDQDLTNLLVDFTETKLEDEKSWHVEGDIKEAAKFLFSEGSQRFIRQLHEIPVVRFHEIAAEIRKLRKAFSESLKAKASEAMTLITGQGIALESFAQGKNGIGGYFKKLASGIISEASATIHNNVSEGKWTAVKADAGQLQAIHSIRDRLAEIFYDCMTIMEKGLPRYTMLGMVGKNIFQMGVLHAMELEIEAISLEKNMLHISEFNKRITDIIVKEPVPFIYERIGEKYYHYLIDEFQDTSELQWKNLLPLVGDSLANNRYNLVVGDGKQAIYRFRNGKVEQFMVLPALPAGFEKEVFGETGRSLVLNYKPELLQSNFRSLPEIIRFNNDFFESVSKELNTDFKPIYENHAQKIMPGKIGGLVSIEFLAAKSKAEFDSLNISRVHQLVEELAGKGYSYGDIAVLTRSNNEGNMIARHLMANGISVVSAEALLLAASAEVNLVVAVLRYLQNRNDSVAEACIINYLGIRSLIYTRLYEVFPNAKTGMVTLEKVLASGGISFNADVLLRLPLYDLCEEIIRLFSLNTGEYDLYLQFFLDFVNNAATKDVSHLAGLLEAWEQKKGKLSVVVPEGIEAVRIMTIHKAKGLEFPVVIWPMADHKPETTFKQLWVELSDDTIPGLPFALVQASEKLTEVGFADQYDREKNSSLLDMLNVIYVAFTRPAERLYILTKQIKGGDPRNLPNLLSRFIEETKDQWQEHEFGFFRGIDEPVHRAKKDISDGGYLSGNMVSTPWQDRIRIARRAPAYWSMETSSNKVSWGTLVHDTLAMIRSKSDIQGVVEMQVQINMLNQEEMASLQTRVTTTVEHEMLKSYFNEDVTIKPEAAILTPEGKVFRPDRVVFNENETVVMEFKTGLPESLHAQQLYAYGDILQNMGYPGIRKLLVYIAETTTVMEI